MIKIMFVCHGNICRSPMAEFVLRDMVKKAGLEEQFYIASSATSTEELGNWVHHGTRNKLAQYGISTEGKHAVQLKKKDYSSYDFLIGMDQRNITNMLRIVGEDKQKKIFRLLNLTDSPRDIADPWYTGDFDRTYLDIKEGCEALLQYVWDKIRK